MPVTSDNPLVSVIVPVFNASRWIQGAYEQVSGQTYKNLEIIFIDNNSTDDSSNLIRKISASDDRVRLLSESRQGAGAARNKGIRESKGSILSFLDADDTIVPWKIESHVNIFKEDEQIKLVYGQIVKSYADEKRSYIIPLNPGPPGRKESIDLATKWMLNFSELPGINAVSCIKEAAASTGGFEERLNRGEDAAFLFKMALNHTCYYQDKVVGNYIRHPESTTSTDNKNTGNPYYIQFKTFYLPYLRDTEVQPHLAKIASERTMFLLFNHLHSLNITLTERVKVLSDELSALRNSGMGKNSNRILRLAVMFPYRLGHLLLNTWSIVFGKI